MLRRVAAAGLALALALALAAGACGSLPEPLLCGEIPSGGCPIGRGGTCDDDTCLALYDCVGGDWVKRVPCHGNAGGGGSGGAGGASPGPGGGGQGGAGGACTPFMFDHTGEAMMCPDLENPDCPAVAAEGCLEDACKVDCLDFFLCTADGLIDVGYCDDDGGFHDTQKGQ